MSSSKQSCIMSLFLARANKAKRHIFVFVSLLLSSLYAHASVAIDANVSTDRVSASATVATPAFSTSTGNELLLAFVATDYRSGANTSVKSIAGGGLTWVLVVRTNRQSGTSEVWRAFATNTLSNIAVTATLSQSVVSSITVVSFTGVNVSGTNGSGSIGATGSQSAGSGAPTATLVTNGSNSWVMGVGNDFDNAIARTPGAGQTMVHQSLSSTGDTYWVQMIAGAVAASGTLVTINDTVPTTDQYNLSIVEVLAASGVPTWSISGTISGGAGSTVALSGTATATTTADATGSYNFTGLANGNYTVTPSKSGFTISPTNEVVTVSGAKVTGVNFTATAVTWSISGTINGGAGSTVALSGAATATTTADAAGSYNFTSLANGNYTVKPSKSGSTMSPANQAVTVIGASVTGVNFTATAGTWSISGTISGGASSTVTLSGAASATTAADAAGSYNFTGLANGNYTVTPSKSGSTMSPANQAVIVSGANVAGVNFTAVAQTWAMTGSITPVTIGMGSTVTLSQNGNTISTATVGSNGGYAFSNVANGNYLITPAKSGVSFTPNTQNVTVNSGSVTVPAFTAAQTSAITLIQKNVNGNESTITSISASFPTNNTAGNFVIVTGTAARPAGTLIISDTAGNTYAPAMNSVTDSVQDVTAYIWYVPSCKGGANTVTLTPATPAALEIHVSEWSGLATTSPVDQTASATGSGTTASSGAAITTLNGELIFGYTFLFNTATAGTGFTPISLVNGDLDEYQVQSTAGSIATTFTQTSGTWFALMATFKPAGGSSGGAYSISGTVSPAGSGYSLALTGAATANTTTNSSGSFSFGGLASGSYTVTPSQAGFTFMPTYQNVTVSTGSVSGINFAAQPISTSTLAIDANVSKDNVTAASTITTPAFSTTSGNELLLALVATDAKSANMTVTSVTGSGPTWSLVKRTNANGGTSEIWQAFATSSLSNVSVTANLSQSVVGAMTVLSFSGANPLQPIGATGSGSAASGAPTASLTTTQYNSWVLGVGNDFDNAIARTVPVNQTLIHQNLSPSGDTYWVQRLSNPVAASGTSVTINDTAPTGDRYNMSIVEVLASSSIVDTTPPAVSMMSPAVGATVASLATVSAIASDDTSVVGVQFLLDGAPLGSEITSAPYSMIWNSATATAGPHTLAALARDSVGLTTTSSPVAVTVDNSGAPAVVGSWTSPISLPVVAVNLILLQNNRVMFYQDGPTATLWDYVQNTLTSVPTSIDIFCSGHALLPDGRILVVGGFGGGSSSFGIANAEIFDPTAGTWTPVPNMTYKRWYPNATTLPDGRILVVAGWQTSAHSNAGISEIYDPVTNGWTQLTNANNPFETYPFIYVLPDGRVIHIGGSEFATDTDILDLTTNSWSVVDPNIVDGGSATMYSPSKFVKAGSAADSQEVGPSSNTTFVLDMTKPAPTWHQTPSMAYPRTFFNLTMLPDGSVLATGGETDKDGGNIANAVYAAELWSPQTQTWSTMSSMHTPREYHGTALLLPDGRVLVSGMGADFGKVPDQKSAELYSPPYLFKGARPTISQAPSQIHYGSSFFVGTPDAGTAATVTLIRTGAVTHFFDQNERFVPLSFTQTSGGLTVTVPANANLAPPGYYMLFIVNSAGVPSIAPFVQVN